MFRYKYERLSAQDYSFLLLETPTVGMHVAATAIYEAGPLEKPDGGIDIDRIKSGVRGVLHLIPRYRQKLRWIPYTSQPVWVDDRHFDIDYHVRHTALPKPGSDEQLKKLASRIMAQHLDRSRPLWELWVVEGLSDHRFAIISKIHHCMVDGSAAVDLATVLMSVTPDYEPAKVHQFIPRPSPASIELLRDEILRRLAMPVTAARKLWSFTREVPDVREEVAKRVRAVGELLGYAVRSASRTPLNGRLGPHRRFDWLEMPLEELRAVRRVYGCTLNDLVLATVAGAVRAYLERRWMNPEEVDFRVSAPVSVRDEGDRGRMGNKVSSWILRLPVGEPDPVKRLETIRAATEELKRSEKALGVQMLMAAAEWAPAKLLSLGSRATRGPINMIVTNVPGPQIPLYMLGARLRKMIPQVPLLENTGLGIALFSYDGTVFWGLIADPGLVPDLPEFVRMIGDSFAELRVRAGVLPAGHGARPSNGGAAATEAARGNGEQSVLVVE
ncbi:MAG: wax ester/triacylglycerol synthase family O-acyltransferase [Deltaproteobacteria bacterium]|nr:MAG: wax ester/triacylglycerol synthase family O-acyltransferase [Deltaproteobacteria bacterium]